ncbi:MAG: SulP family inorganic anion transporter, partial [Betaproteobacteria bacterium]
MSAFNDPPSALQARLARLLPWTLASDRRTVRADLIAGTTLAAYAVPSSIAYAQLAGMPVQTGLYCYLLAGLAYALFGTSRQLAIGPTSSIALTLATTLGALVVDDPARYMAMAAAAALLTGTIALGAWAMRWGGIVHFVSETVLTGFKIGAGIVIGVSQLPLLFGIPNTGRGFEGTLFTVVRNVSSAHAPTLILGLVAYLLLLFGQWRRPLWPISLLVVIVAIAFASMPGYEAWGIASVGAIPAGLPALHLPTFTWQDLDTLLPLAFACFLLAFNEGIAAARLLATRHGYAIDPNRELLGLGAVNIGIAFGHGFPSGGGLSQSLVNDQAGARSPLAGVICSLWMIVVLLYLTGLFVRLPQPLLAALVLASVIGMFRFDELRQLWRIDTSEFAIAALTIAAVLVLGILQGVLVAAVFSLAMLIRRLAAPECVVLGRFPGTNTYAAFMRHPEVEAIPDILIFRANAALLYFNADGVQDRI